MTFEKKDTVVIQGNFEIDVPGGKTRKAVGYISLTAYSTVSRKEIIKEKLATRNARKSVVVDLKTS